MLYSSKGLNKPKVCLIPKPVFIARESQRSSIIFVPKERVEQIVPANPDNKRK